MTAAEPDPVKRQVAAHWNRRAAHFDEDFGHSIGSPEERAAWDRVLALCLPQPDPLDALDIGCGTGFLSLELWARGHRVTGVDFAPAMLDRARAKAAERGASIGFEEADAEALPFASGSFDLAVSRHLLWTLPHPEAAIDEWVRILRPGGRLVVVDGEAEVGAAPQPQFGTAEPRVDARLSAEYAGIGGGLPFIGGRSQQEIERLLADHGLAGINGDPFLDLVAAQQRRMAAEGLEPRSRRRYAVWGDVPHRSEKSQPLSEVRDGTLGKAHRTPRPRTR
jgi:ubiquinone/menaquinone biosynthesis C-methylase UbiE